MRNFLIILRRLDWLLFLAVLLLLFLSASILYSLNLNIANSDFLVFRKQILYIFTGIVIFLFFSTISYKVWSTFSKLTYVFFILPLLAVLLLGRTIQGTTGWIVIAGFSIQPVEFAKIALIIWLARYFADHAKEFYLFRHIFISGVAVLFYVALVLLQPDLGSSLVLVGTWVIMLLFTGLQRRHLIWLGSLFVSASILAWFFVLEAYQKFRILTFINPGLDPQGQGYNVLQSITAVGSGQIFGRGLALGSQSNLRFLPEPGTDFIFAVVAENLGLFGVLVLLGLFVFIMYRLFGIMRIASDDFGSYFALGVASMFLVQIFINVGMNMGISPVTGIPLPLVSAGGSSLWASMIALGIVQNIYISHK
jgi:rod shape determining protein RodA